MGDLVLDLCVFVRQVDNIIKITFAANEVKKYV